MPATDVNQEVSDASDDDSIDENGMSYKELFLQAKERAEKERDRRRLLEKKMNGEVGPTGRNKATPEKIPRPQGTAGNKGYNLQTKMRLDSCDADKNELYLAICRHVRDLTIAAQLDWRVPFRRQPKDDLAKIYRLAMESFDYLKQFECCWPVDEIISQHFRNKRKYNAKMGRFSNPRGKNRAFGRGSDQPPQNDEDHENRPPIEPSGSRTSSSAATAVEQRPKPRPRKRQKTQPAHPETSDNQAPSRAAPRREKPTTRAAGQQPTTRAQPEGAA
ncbi:hypothetical protein PUNSTDRAFT_136523 [Punctularia strigosozonata HHB-11173 SS5]|uniref:uncharacterized protein n=1 Tax=Punctularia strigosozonata (strain HHB-11173) TaxID=741275 RepID=UPI00044165CF|nr:uncharacterized protein PUNSTDRAFT_136523 [Punctularia strigosozonata HHB-11173 SS5]EIN06678.1 hypothetical protein PUNSTDRAFT_136523 [Punctularia strigosozonata HHB-11173 SS5]